MPSGRRHLLVKHSILLISFSQVVPFIGVGAIFAWAIGLVAGIRYLKSRDVRWRSTIEPLCSWEYSAAEWADYAKRFDLAKVPKGSAMVKITAVDVWITDAGRVRRNELDGDRKCVVDCEITAGLLKIYVTSWAIQVNDVNRTYTHLNLELPIPRGKEADAARALDYFKANMIKQAEKVAWVRG